VRVSPNATCAAGARSTVVAMPDLVFGPAAIEHARTTVASEARRVPAIADVVTVVPGAAFGPLAAGVEVVGALHQLAEALDGELGAGGRRLEEVDRGLDAVLRVLESMDGDDARALDRRM